MEVEPKIAANNYDQLLTVQNSISVLCLANCLTNNITCHRKNNNFVATGNYSEKLQKHALLVTLPGR